MDNKIVSSSVIFDFKTKWAVDTLKGRLEEAEKAYRNQVNDIINRVITYLNENPDATMTAVDIAAVTGLSVAVVKHWMDKNGWNKGLTWEHVYVTRKFAQVDEDGNLIPNGRTMNQSIKMKGYRQRRDSEYWR